MTGAPAAIRIQALAPNHFNEWETLYRGYADFYRQPMNARILQTAWEWLMAEKLHGIIAHRDNQAAGFAHWELILRPLRGVALCYLHDLYVDANARNSGCGARLLAHAGAAAQQQGCENMRWLTKADNHTARRLYDKTAQAATDWVMYQQTLTPQ